MMSFCHIPRFNPFYRIRFLLLYSPRNRKDCHPSPRITTLSNWVLGSLEEVPMADPNSKPELFELSNGTMSVLITNLGCTITSLSVPGKDGISVLSCILIFVLSQNRFLSFFLLFSFLWVCGNVNDVWVLTPWILWREIGWCCSWIRLSGTISGKIL